ncbi:transmembrane gamma-carboxyglutamic acid protein 2 [Pholidichthys leucotaenia]
MATLLAIWTIVLSLLQIAHCSVIHRHTGDSVLLDDEAAASFLSRSLLYNNWDFELIVPDDLKRECIEEICVFEEAREVFEDDTLGLEKFWNDYTEAYAPPVDISGLVAGILAIVVSAVIATVLGIYCYKAKHKSGQRSQAPVTLGADGHPVPEAVPLAAVSAPGLPSYNEALNRSGQYDAPPPPYSGGAPSEPADPGDNG